MKKIIGIGVVMACMFPAKALDKEIVKSTISEVTVYAQGAQIFQKANYSLKPGTTEIIIEGISPFIDAKSLQVKATGNSIILDSKYSVFYPKPAEVSLEGLPLKIRRDIQLLEDSIKFIGYDIQDIQDDIDVMLATKTILSNNGAIRGQGKVNDSINLLKQAVDYYTLKMSEINKKLQALNRKKAEKLERKTAMNDRLSKLKKHQSSSGLLPQDQGPTHRITVTFSTKEIVTGKISISYLVENAGWVPLYDLRSDGLTSKINLTYKAQVFQNSGLDWENVKLNISTNNPFQNKTKPTLHPWYVDYYVYRNYGNNRDNAPQSMMKKESEKSIAYSNSIGEQDDVMSQTSAQFVEVVRQLTSAEFRIDLPYTIKSNNEQHMVLIKVADLEANYKYYTVPKLDNSVYLIAQLSKLDELGLVPAQANIFFDGSYVGETYIDPTSMEDTLNLSLGKDPNIMVKRLLVKKDTKEKIVGDKKERILSYSIEVKNMKATPIEIVVQDQVPITQNAEISIETLELGKGELDARTGIIEWKFSLKPKEGKLLNFSYKVTHKKEMNVSL
ncbi:MAG: hypothetical protein RL265_1001 [Bacteroidota bacterium]